MLIIVHINYLTLVYMNKEKYNKDIQYIGSTDDNWASIAKLNGKYYKIEAGLQEHEGRIYITEVELL